MKHHHKSTVLVASVLLFAGCALYRELAAVNENINNYYFPQPRDQSTENAPGQYDVEAVLLAGTAAAYGEQHCEHLPIWDGDTTASGDALLVSDTGNLQAHSHAFRDSLSQEISLAALLNLDTGQVECISFTPRAPLPALMTIQNKQP